MIDLKNKKLIICLGIASLLIGTLVFALERNQVIDLYSKRMRVNSGNEAVTTSSSRSAQSNFTGATDNKDPGNTVGENDGTASVSDTNGTGVTNTANPAISSTGEISVYYPGANKVVKVGDSISGSSTLSAIQYRLIDNVSGVIATGELQVVAGKFSGKLSFNTSANEGRVDIYATRSNGVEFSNVEIPVRFSQ